MVNGKTSLSCAGKTKTVKEAWEAHQIVFEDKGVNNRHRLLGKLVSLKLKQFNYRKSPTYVSESFRNPMLKSIFT